MDKLAVFIVVLYCSIHSWAQTATPDNAYKQPYPHSTGAEMLEYCGQTDVVASQLRCDYYVQGVADLAVIPRQGRPLACIPRGQNRTQLMRVAVRSLKAANPQALEQQSAASMILNSFRAAFPCPAVESAGPDTAPAVSEEITEAIKKAMQDAKKVPPANADAAPAVDKEMVEAIKKAMRDAKKAPPAEAAD